MRKILILLIATTLILSLTGCTLGADETFESSKGITVVTREDGSGTRGAFIELFGIQLKGDNGSKKDKTTKDAVTVKQTDIMMTNISNDKYSIGYTSMGSMNETVKGLDIEGISPTAENVKNGSYAVSRAFIIATKAELSELAQDFINYILSSDGQSIVAKSYIAVNDTAQPFTGGNASGKIVVAGSSSVYPVMEKLKEAYLLINPNSDIEIQQTDSTSGISGAIEGTCDIGMSSRELKDAEKIDLTETQIALDGIIIIVNKVNPITNMEKEQVRSIFTGESTSWSEVNS